MRITFFNPYHNGDVNVSRGFVRKIMERAPEHTYKYSHKNPANLLADIPNLAYDPIGINSVPNDSVGIFVKDDTTFINTWYCQQNFKFYHKYKITFDSLYCCFDENCKKVFGFSLSDISKEPKDFYPTIDYTKFEIGNAKKWLGGNTDKKVLIENGQVLSGQAHDFNMTQVIANVARNHKDTTFILSNHGNVGLPNNCIYADKIIQKNMKSDLNEISFLSTHCDVIIGKASGVFSFCLTQQNLFERQAKYLCFSKWPAIAENKFWLHNLMKDRIEYSSKILVSGEANVNRIASIIEANI